MKLDFECPDIKLIVSALHAKGRIPQEQPQLGLLGHFYRDNLLYLYLEEHPGGWVANISFRHAPIGFPNTMGTPDAHPFESKKEAWLAGAALVCWIVTGSYKLPFFMVGNKLMVACYRG